MAQKQDSIAKDALAGLIGGLVAAAVMNVFMETGMEAMKNSLSHAELERRTVKSPEGMSPTAKTASAVAERVAGKKLSVRDAERMDPVVHYAFGGLLGALYGVLSRRAPAVGAGRGTGYGTAVWLGADVAALPALRLSRAPNEYPASTHAFGLGAHLVYGATLDAFTAIARNLL
ncbi:MAG TPA: DUF1440 domain-containing protein [Elusimicrobiota bacterium]|nr:DUF1440 domain-containing protein [Elusimicrobiota bacterium]